MSQRIYEILEGSIALTVLVAIIGISSFSVLALNPGTITSKPPMQNIAGVTSDMNDSDNQIYIKNLENNTADYQNNLVYQDDKSYLYSSHLNGGEGALTFQFAEISNSGKEPVTLNLNTMISGPIQNNLRITLFDQTDTLILLSPEQGANPLTLTIPANGKRTLNIAYEFLQKINFGFDVKINIQ